MTPYDFRALKFFDHVTGRQLNVYFDAELTTPHAQPVFRGANGEWPPIFIDVSASGATGDAQASGAVYGVALLDYRGAELWRLSPLTGTPALRSFWWRVLCGE